MFKAKLENVISPEKSFPSNLINTLIKKSGAICFSF